MRYSITWYNVVAAGVFPVLVFLAAWSTEGNTVTDGVMYFGLACLATALKLRMAVVERKEIEVTSRYDAWNGEER